MIKKILIIVGIVLIVIVLGLWSLFYLFRKAMCGDDQFVKYQSPNQKHEVVSYRRNCGATTTYVYIVELDGKTILLYTYGEPVSAKWIDNKNVFIETASSSPYMKTYKILEKYNNIQINFGQDIKSSYRVN